MWWTALKLPNSINLRACHFKLPIHPEIIETHFRSGLLARRREQTHATKGRRGISGTGDLAPVNEQVQLIVGALHRQLIGCGKGSDERGGAAVKSYRVTASHLPDPVVAESIYASEISIADVGVGTCEPKGGVRPSAAAIGVSTRTTSASASGP